MLRLVTSNRVYSPATITLMTEAFEAACQSAPKLANSDEDVRKAAALAILKSVDNGELDLTRLVDLAAKELAC